MRLTPKRYALMIALAFGLTIASIPNDAEAKAWVVAKAKKKKRRSRSKQKKPKKKFSEIPQFDEKKPVQQEPTEILPTGPAKIKLPMVEERKAAGASLEEKLLEQEIAQIKDIIRTQPDGPSRCDLYFRLAERYYEKARSIFYLEMQEYDKKAAAWAADPKKAEPKIDNRKSQVYTDQAMSIYQKILNKCANYSRRDEVLFTMGYNLYESGKKSQGVKMYWELIKTHPESRFVPDAYLAMGEHFFSNNDVFKARTAYEKALQFKNSKVYTFALYKLGWCDYNLGDYEKALDKFKKVVELALAESEKPGGDRNKIQLREEALQDMVLCFSQIDALDAAEEYYLSQVGKKTTLVYLRKLARTYEKQGKAEMTVKAFRRLLNEYPTNPECPAFHNSIVMAYRKMNMRTKVKREINRLIDQYKPGSTWAEVNRDNRMAIKKANSLVEGSLRDLVTSYHKEAQDTKSWDTYNLARSIYAKYLEVFPKSEYAYKLRWYYADILYKMRDFYSAAKQYSLVVETDKKGVFSAEASYNAVLCWEKCIEMRDTAKQDCRDFKAQKGSKKLQKEAPKVIKKQDFSFVQKGVTKDMLVTKKIPTFEKDFLEAADIYATVAPDHDMYIPIRFKSAFIFYKYRHFAQMTKRFGEIIERHPKNEFALKAVRLSLNALYMRARQEGATQKQKNKAWADLNHWAKKFSSNKVLVGSKAAQKEKFSKELMSLIQESGYNVVLALRKTDPMQAAKGFDQFVKNYPKSKYAHRAQYAAMVIYDEADQLDLAITSGRRLLKNYPESDRINATIGYLASFYDRVADFANAARYNEMLFDKWLAQTEVDAKGKKKSSKKSTRTKKEKKKKEKQEASLITKKQASDALYNAGLLRESMGQFNEAIANYSKYIKYFPENKDSHELFYKIGNIYERQEKWKNSARIYEGYLSKYGERSSPARKLEVMYNNALVLRKMNKLKESDKLMAAIIEAYAKLDKDDITPQARKAVAHARFLQVEKDFDEYMKLKLVLPPRVLKKNLFRKIEQRPKLEKMYKEIVAFGDPDWSIAALVRIGKISQDLADAMLDAPTPAGLTPEQADIYVEELQKQALPLEEKAIGLYRKAIAVSTSKGIYNPWTLKAQNLLRKYEPNKYPEPYLAKQVSTEFFYQAELKLDKIEVPKQPDTVSAAKPSL